MEVSIYALLPTLLLTFINMLFLRSKINVMSPFT